MDKKSSESDTDYQRSSDSDFKETDSSFQGSKGRSKKTKKLTKRKKTSPIKPNIKRPNKQPVSRNKPKTKKKNTPTSTASSATASSATDTPRESPLRLVYGGYNRSYAFHSYDASGEKLYKISNSPAPPKPKQYYYGLAKQNIELKHPELAASGLSVSEVNDTESETETELEFDGVTYEMIKTPTPTGSRQPHRTYLLKGRSIEKPARKQAIINYLQRKKDDAEVVKQRTPLVSPKSTLRIEVRGREHELREEHKPAKDGRILFRSGNGKMVQTKEGWISFYEKMDDTSRVASEWMKNPTRPIPGGVRVNPFRINPKNIFETYEEAILDAENLEEMKDLLDKRDTDYDKASSYRQRRFVYFVIIVNCIDIKDVIRDGNVEDLFVWLRENENNPNIQIRVYIGVNSRAPHISQYHFRPTMDSSIRREMSGGKSRAFVLHIIEITGRSDITRKKVTDLEAMIIAYFKWICPFLSAPGTNTQDGKAQYVCANRKAEFDIFYKLPPETQKHILALASSRSIRPFCYDECTTSHNINSMPYSAMTHPDRETISEIFLDQLHVNFDEEDPNYSDYDVSDEFDDDYIPQSGCTASITEKIDEDFGLLDEMLEDNDFLSSLYYEQQTGNFCGQHALNNFLQESTYSRSILNDIAQELFKAQRQILATSQNPYASEDGDYNVSVLLYALHLSNYATSQSITDFNIDTSVGLIVNDARRYHWYSIRRIGNRWIMFDTLPRGEFGRRLLSETEVLEILNRSGWVVAPKIIDNKVEKETQIKNGTEIYDKWVNIPVPIYLKFYIWNVTNYEKFQSTLDRSAKPQLNEIGPYVYKENRIKYDIKPNPDNDTVIYRQNITYTFVREMSVGPDTDVFNIVNVPFFSVAAVLATQKNLSDITPLLLKLLEGPLSRERLVKMDVSVRDIIFGWRLNWIYDIISSVGSTLGMHFPPEMQDGKFGFYLNRNNTNADGEWEIYSGIKDSSKFSVLKHINGSPRLDEWWDDECAMINGTDGTMFSPITVFTYYCFHLLLFSPITVYYHRQMSI